MNRTYIHKINNIDFDIKNIDNIDDTDNLNDMFFDKDIVNIFIMKPYFILIFGGWKN